MKGLVRVWGQKSVNMFQETLGDRLGERVVKRIGGTLGQRLGEWKYASRMKQHCLKPASIIIIQIFYKNASICRSF